MISWAGIEEQVALGTVAFMPFLTACTPSNVYPVYPSFFWRVHRIHIFGHFPFLTACIPPKRYTLPLSFGIHTGVHTFFLANVYPFGGPGYTAVYPVYPVYPSLLSIFSCMNCHLINYLLFVCLLQAFISNQS